MDKAPYANLVVETQGIVTAMDLPLYFQTPVIT